MDKDLSFQQDKEAVAMSETLSQIKEKLDNCDKGGLSAFILDYDTDNRTGVKKLNG